MKANLKGILLLAIFAYSLFNTCQDLSTVKHDCSYYIECLENNYSCGADGYPVGYGNKYCSRFLEFFNDFPREGQEWIEKTLTCLKKAIQDVISVKPEQTCKNIYDIAFNSHPDCYVNSGFCSAMIHNTFSMTKALLKVYEVKDFMSFTSIKQVIVTAKKCGVDVSVKIMEAIKDILGQEFTYDFNDIDSPF